jgi:NitT/TauT family transport system permease protein
VGRVRSHAPLNPKDAIVTKPRTNPAFFRELFEKVRLPIVLFIVIVGGWELTLWAAQVPPYLFPKPSDIVKVTVTRWDNLTTSVATTIVEALIGFAVSVVLGVGVAVLMSLSKAVEKGFYPYTIILQTLPIVAVAPIIVIWFGAGINAIVIISFLISFFPILTNTLTGLNSTDQNLKNLFFLYNAKKFQTIWKLRFPAALPYVMTGLRISCSSAVVGAIVGEYIAGIGGGRGGLGYGITVAASRMETPYLFACGFAAALMGIVFFLVINAVSNRLLGSWHESAMA